MPNDIDPRDLEQSEEDQASQESKGRLDGNNRRIEEFLARQADTSLDAMVSKKYLGKAQELLSDSIPHRLDAGERQDIERVLGFDASHVRIHTGEKAQQAADALNARAFALGDSDVFFGRGEYSTDSPAGKALLAHELTHVFEATQPVALATRDELDRSGLRPGEDTAHQAEQQMFREASENQELDRKDIEPKDLTLVEKTVLEDKVWKILQERSRLAGDRFGRR